MSTAVQYQFRARDANGVEQRGTVQGDSTSSIARELVSRGLVPIDIKALSKGASPAAAQAPAPAAAGADVGAKPAQPAQGKPITFSFSFGNPAHSKRAQVGFGLVLRELAALLRAGVPLMRALKLATDGATEEPVRDALTRLARDLDNGHNLVAAAEHEHRISGLITSYDIAMLQVGEQTGRLPEALADLHRHREFQRATAEQVASALRYPSFVILTCVLAMVVVNIFVIPSFAKVFAQAHAELPMLTLFLLGMSNFMLAYWHVLLVSVAAAVYGWRRWLGTPEGRLWWDRVKLRIPVVGSILEGIVLARLSASLASSISAGLTLSDSITVTSRTLANTWFEGKLSAMNNELARGTSIAAASRNMGVLPPTMVQMFAIGEESGSLEELMREISVHYQSNVDFSVKRLSATLEPILIWFLGMCVLVLALGVFMPMWDLGKATMH